MGGRRLDIEGNTTITGPGRSEHAVDRPLRFDVQLPNDPSSIAFVRKAAMSASDACGPETSEIVGLIVTELVTNALVHGHLGEDERIAVVLTISPDGISGEVTDPGVGFELNGDPQPSVEGGFGLFIVQRLARRWGVDTSSAGQTRVWFEL